MNPPAHYRNDGAVPAHLPAASRTPTATTATRVRLHTHGGAVEVRLLDVKGVYSWDDLALMVKSVVPIEAIEVGGDRRYAFAAGVVLWAEVVAADAG